MAGLAKIKNVEMSKFDGSDDATRRSGPAGLVVARAYGSIIIDHISGHNNIYAKPEARA